MARIAGVDLPREKRIEIGLTYVFGIGRAKADKILSMTGINPDTRVRDLTDDEVAKIREAIDETHTLVEGDLRREVAMNIKRLMEIGCYRGIRHRSQAQCGTHRLGFHVEVRRLRQTLEQEKVLEELLRTRRNN